MWPGIVSFITIQIKSHSGLKILPYPIPIPFFQHHPLILSILPQPTATTIRAIRILTLIQLQMLMEWLLMVSKWLLKYKVHELYLIIWSILKLFIHFLQVGLKMWVSLTLLRMFTNQQSIIMSQVSIQLTLKRSNRPAKTRLLFTFHRLQHLPQK
jgi:hypothetical protein